MTALAVAVGAFVGAPLRWHADLAFKRWFGHGFPWGVLAANVVASAVLGLAAGTSGVTASLVGTGFCGALSTYSTFGYDTVRMLQRREHGKAVAHVAVTVAAGLIAVSLGRLAAG